MAPRSPDPPGAPRRPASVTVHTVLGGAALEPGEAMAPVTIAPGPPRAPGALATMRPAERVARLLTVARRILDAEAAAPRRQNGQPGQPPVEAVRAFQRELRALAEAPVAARDGLLVIAPDARPDAEALPWGAIRRVAVDVRGLFAAFLAQHATPAPGKGVPLWALSSALPLLPLPPVSLGLVPAATGAVARVAWGLDLDDGLRLLAWDLLGSDAASDVRRCARAACAWPFVRHGRAVYCGKACQNVSAKGRWRGRRSSDQRKAESKQRMRRARAAIRRTREARENGESTR